jgi:hypothetical protein
MSEDFEVIQSLMDNSKELNQTIQLQAKEIEVYKRALKIHGLDLDRYKIIGFTKANEGTIDECEIVLTEQLI